MYAKAKKADWNARISSPFRFGAWDDAFNALAREIEAGPGLICLIGPDGCGKTFLLSFYEMAAGDRRLALRTPDATLATDTAIDLVDGVRCGTVAALVASLPPGMTRVLSMRPETLLGLPGKGLASRAVYIAPMGEFDVRTMVKARCRQMGGSPGIFSDEALAALVQSAGGSPRQVDKLVREAMAALLQSAGGSPRQIGELVPEAIRHTVDQDHKSVSGAYLQAVAESQLFRKPLSTTSLSDHWLDGAGRQGGNLTLREDRFGGPQSETPALVDPVVAQQDVEMAVRFRPGRYFHSLGRAGVIVVLASALASVPTTHSARLPGLLGEPAMMPQQAATSASVTKGPRADDLPVVEVTPVSAATEEVPASRPEAVPPVPAANDEAPAFLPEAAPPALPEATVPALPPTESTVPVTETPIEPPSMLGRVAVVAAIKSMPTRQANPTEALRLLTLADTMLSAGQGQDAAEMLRAAAALGNKKAKSRLGVSTSPR